MVYGLTHLRTLAVAPKQHRLVVAARLGAPKHRVRHAPGESPHGEAGGYLIPPLWVVFGVSPPGRRCPQRATFFCFCLKQQWSCCERHTSFAHVACCCAKADPPGSGQRGTANMYCTNEARVLDGDDAHESDKVLDVWCASGGMVHCCIRMYVFMPLHPSVTAGMCSYVGD